MQTFLKQRPKCNFHLFNAKFMAYGNGCLGILVRSRLFSPVFCPGRVSISRPDTCLAFPSTHLLPMLDRRDEVGGCFGCSTPPAGGDNFFAHYLQSILNCVAFFILASTSDRTCFCEAARGNVMIGGCGLLCAMDHLSWWTSPDGLSDLARREVLSPEREGVIPS